MLTSLKIERFHPKLNFLLVNIFLLYDPRAGVTAAAGTCLSFLKLLKDLAETTIRPSEISGNLLLSDI